MNKLLRQFNSDEFEALIKSMKGGNIFQDLSGPIDTSSFLIEKEKFTSIEQIISNFEKILDTLTDNNNIVNSYIQRKRSLKKEDSMELKAFTSLPNSKLQTELERFKAVSSKTITEMKRITAQSSSVLGDIAGAVGGIGGAGIAAIGAGVVGAGLGYYAGSRANPNSDAEAPTGSKAEHMQTLYNAFKRYGMTDEGAKTMIAQINRENNFQEKYLFGVHIDAANQQVNAGMVSWQRDRAKEFIAFMTSKGLYKDGRITKGKESLEAQAQFLVMEMKGKKLYRPSWEAVTNPQLKYADIEHIIGDNYFGWARDDPRFKDSGYRNQNQGYAEITSLVNQGFPGAEQYEGPSVRRAPPDMSSANNIVKSLVPGMRRVSEEFDPNSRGGRGHFGMDISGTEGSPINSVGAGKVIRANSAGGYGNRIEIEHPNGLVSSYSHLSKFRVKVGDEVRAGQVIGLMGSTGRSSGPHLHLEFQRGAGGKRVDPRLALQSFVQKPKVRRSIQPVILKQPAQQSSQNTRSAPASGVQPTKKTGGTTSTSLRDFYELAEKF